MKAILAGVQGCAFRHLDVADNLEAYSQGFVSRTTVSCGAARLFIVITYVTIISTFLKNMLIWPEILNK